MPNSERGFSIPLLVFVVLVLYGATSFVYSRVPTYLAQNQNETKKEKPPSDMSDPEGFIIMSSPTHILGTTNISKDTFSPFNSELSALYPNSLARSGGNIIPSPNKTKFITTIDHLVQTDPLSPIHQFPSEYFLLSMDGKIFKKLNLEDKLRTLIHPTFPFNYGVNWGKDDNSLYLKAHIRLNALKDEDKYFLYHLDTDEIKETATPEAKLNTKPTRDPQDDQIIYHWSPSENIYLRYQNNNDLIEVFDSKNNKITETHLGTFNDPKENTTSPPKFTSPFRGVLFSTDEQDLLFVIDEGEYTDHPRIKWKTLNLKTSDLKTVKTFTREEAYQFGWPIIWKKP